MLATARERAVDLGYAAGWGAVKYAPAGLSRRAFRRAGDFAANRNGTGTRQLRKNLRRVVGPEVSEPEMDRLVQQALRSYSRYWLETFRLPRMDKAAVATSLDATMVGREHIDKGLAAGKGVVLALPHMGNWDASGIWLVAHHGSFLTVAERLKPESLFERFVAYRQSLGFEVHAIGNGSPSPTAALTAGLAENKIVCLLADRDLSRNGVEVEFFGETTKMPPGPALLGATTGAAVLPVGLWFTEDGWAHRVHPPLEVPEGRLRDKVQAMTQQLATVFEREIAEHPADWHMLQKFWLSDLTKRPEDEPVS